MTVSTNVSPSLHPNNITALEGYNDSTSKYLAPVVTAFDEAYQSIQAVHEAREKADKNPAWTDASKVLQTANLAEKYQGRVCRKFDDAWSNLGKAITAIDEELSKPLEQLAGAGTVNGEIRTYSKSLERKERAELMTKAIQSNDTKTLGAILGAPPYLSGWSDVEHAHYQRLYHETSQPERANLLAVMKEARKKMGSVNGIILNGFEKAVGADWSKVQKLRKANSEAEQAFILKDTLNHTL